MKTELTELCFVVGGKPVPWKRARRRFGRYFTELKMAAHKRTIGYTALAAMADLRIEKTNKPVALYCEFHGCDPRMDADNGAKLVADALEGIVYDNDKQVFDQRGQKFPDSEPPRTEIQIRVLRDGTKAA